MLDNLARNSSADSAASHEKAFLRGKIDLMDAVICKSISTALQFICSLRDEKNNNNNDNLRYKISS